MSCTDAGRRVWAATLKSGGCSAGRFENPDAGRSRVLDCEFVNEELDNNGHSCA